MTAEYPKHVRATKHAQIIERPQRGLVLNAMAPVGAVFEVLDFVTVIENGAPKRWYRLHLGWMHEEDCEAVKE